MTRDPLDDGPGIDGEALRRVADADLRPPPRRPRGGSAPGWLVGVGAGVAAIAVVGFLILGRGEAPARVEPLDDPSPPPVVAPSPMPSAVEVAPVPVDAPPPPPRVREDRTVAPEPKPARGAARGEREAAVEAALDRLEQKGGADLLRAAGFVAARSALEAECKGGGHGDSCLALGKGLLEEGRGAADVAQAMAALDDACTQRQREACLIAARRWAAEPETRIRAEELFVRACDQASAAGCKGAAELIEARDPDGPKALSLRARACALGDRDSCKREGTRTSTQGS